jgi:hypothetical protein
LKKLALSIVLSFFFSLTLTSFNTPDGSEKMELEAKVCSHWVEVNPGCDNIFWLCADNYDSAQELVDAAEDFSEGRCE